MNLRMGEGDELMLTASSVKITGHCFANFYLLSKLLKNRQNFDYFPEVGDLQYTTAILEIHYVEGLQMGVAI
jgi:hypothetical protein